MVVGVAPPNTFLETIIQRTKELDAMFLVGNAVVSHHPIIYCSTTFSREFGYKREEVARFDAYLHFLIGRATTPGSKAEVERAIRYKKPVQIEIILYSKTGAKRWYLLHIQPINDKAGKIALLLLTFKAIAHLKAKLTDSPKRRFQKAVRTIMNKPSLEFMRENMEEEARTKKKGADLNQLMQQNEMKFLPKYGSHKVQTPRFIIKHYDQRKLAWDWVILVLILYTSISVPFVVCFAYKSTGLLVFDTFSDVLFITDIVLTFFTTYNDEKNALVVSHRAIRRHYIRTWFFVDTIAAAPYSGISSLLLEELQLNGGRSAAQIWAEIMRILKILRLFRLGKIGSKIERYLKYGFVTLVIWMIFFCLIAHWMACLWYAIALNIDTPSNPVSWLNILGELVGQPYINGTGGPPRTTLYISSLYYTLTSLTTCGFGNIAPNTSMEKLYGCLTMFIGCILYALIFGQITNLIQQFQRTSNHYQEVLQTIKNFNNIYKLPSSIGARLEDYFATTWAATKGIDVEEVLKMCPKDLKAAICLHLHSSVIDEHATFQKLTQSARQQLACCFMTTRTAPGDRVVYQGEAVYSLFFVTKGSLEIKSDKNIVGLVGPGDSFGVKFREGSESDSSLPSMFDVFANSFCELHSLRLNSAREALQLFPQDLDVLVRSLNLTWDITKPITYATRGGLVRARSNKTKEKNVEDQKPRKDKATKGTSNTSNGPSTKRRESVTQKLEVVSLDTNFTSNTDMLKYLHDLKTELRIETERMNSKMGVVEAQIRIILKLLRPKTQDSIDPEVSSRLDDLMQSSNDPHTPQYKIPLSGPITVQNASGIAAGAQESPFIESNTPSEVSGQRKESTTRKRKQVIGQNRVAPKQSEPRSIKRHSPVDESNSIETINM